MHCEGGPWKCSHSPATHPGAEAVSTDPLSWWFCIRKSLSLLPRFFKAPLIRASLGNTSGFLNGLGQMASQRAGGLLPPDQTCCSRSENS